MHVQKHKVRPLFADERDRLGAIARLADDFQVHGVGEQLPEARASQRLVINDQGPDYHDGCATGDEATLNAVRQGIWISAEKPPALPGLSSSEARPP